jgi:hypothetical protein
MSIAIAPIGSGWMIHGADRGFGTPPSPPPAELVRGLIDRGQLEALHAYRAICEKLAESRRREGELRAAVNAAAADDLAAADDAWTAGEATAPPSVRWTREAALDAQTRHSSSGLRQAEAALGDVYAALATPDAQRQLIERAWMALAEDRKPSPTTSSSKLSALLWAINLDRALAPSDRSTVLARFDALPARDWLTGWDALLDELGQLVADKVAALTPDDDA